MTRLTEVAIELLLRNDDLGGGGSGGVWNVVVHNADGTDDLSSNSGFFQARDVGWVADYERGARRLFTASHTDGASRLEKNLINIRVKHIGATVNGAQTTE